MSLRGEITSRGAEFPDRQFEDRAPTSVADLAVGKPPHEPPPPTTDSEGKATIGIETTKHGYEDLCAELDARPPSPLRLEELPQKQADIVRTFMKHGIEPPLCKPIYSILIDVANVHVDAELMGPTSLESFDELRGEPFIDIPDWEKDLLDELLGDPELSKPEISKKMPQGKKTVPKGDEGQGKTNIESKPGTPSKAASD